MRLLYAEDDRILAALYKEMLESAGFDVNMVHDGDRAWESFNKTEPDLVLLDIRMPGRSGLELITNIRGINKEIPVIIFSSLSDTESVMEAFTAGADEFIRKEYSPDEVLARIRMVADRLRKDKQRQSVYELSSRTTFYFSSRTLSVDGEKKQMTMKEAQLLRLLIRKTGDIADKVYLCEGLWGVHNIVKERELDCYMVRLRKYFKADDSIKITTNYGSGICLIGNITEPGTTRNFV